MLRRIEKAYLHFNCNYLIVHPSLVEDWSIFEEFYFNLAIENMSKDTALLYSSEQLKYIFEKNKDFSMTFDIKHAFESDFGRDNLAQELYDSYKEKIVEIHLSGYNPKTNKHEHKPLSATNQPEIVNFAKDKQHIPMIIESDCENPEQMKMEYEYIKNILEN
jgi:hypothetical protein